VTAVTPETKLPAKASRWDSLVWPRWLPVQARLPLIAQITGAVALTALLAAPWWSSIPDTPTAADAAVAAKPAPVPASPAAAVATAAAVPAPAASGVPPSVTAAEDLRPAHLNLEVRHSFKNVDFSVNVDGKPAFQTTVEGSGKRFKVFGKRSERGYTKTLELPPGVRVVRVRILSAEEKFDQTRVERFDLGAASVATLRVSADRSGLSLVAERPPASKPATVQAAVPTSAPTVVPTAASAVPIPATAAPRTAQEANSVVDLLQSVRSILIAIAGFVASAATGFVVQEYLRTRRGLLFAGGGSEQEQPYPHERRRRRRPGRARLPREDGEPGDPADSSGSDSAVRTSSESTLTSE
jgi:hypothetical protein